MHFRSFLKVKVQNWRYFSGFVFHFLGGGGFIFLIILEGKQ